MKFPGLSGLRGLAILIVVLYHLNQSRSVENLALWDWELYQFVALLPVVVSIFFILGGFLRSLAYWKVIFSSSQSLGMDGSDSPNDTVPDFWKGLKDRFFRIAPLFYTALILSFGWAIFLGNVDWNSFIVGFTFLSWLHPDTFFPVIENGPLWFVAYDMMGNLTVMIVMSLWISLSRSKYCRSGGTAKKYSIILYFICIFLLLLVLHGIFTSLPFPTGSGIVSVWFPYYNPFIFGTYYIFGAGIAGLYYSLREKGIKSNILFDMLCIISLSIGGYYLYSILGASDLAHSFPKSPYRYPFIPLLFGIGIFSLLFSKYIPYLLDNRCFLFLARISYPLYLFHTLIIGICMYFILGPTPYGWDTWWRFSVIVLFFSLIFSYFMLKVEELIIQKILKK